MSGQDRITDKRISFDDNGPDKLGRRHFTLTWTDPGGVFRPELSKQDGQPIGYRRGQCFFCDPTPYIEQGYKEYAP